VRSVNCANVQRFLDHLKYLTSRYTLSANKIYNLFAEETGNSAVHDPPQIICAKGIKQVGSVPSGERRINVTMSAAVNATGNHVPPMLRFPRVHFKLANDD
jgi:hypothetical protein